MDEISENAATHPHHRLFLFIEFLGEFITLLCSKRYVDTFFLFSLLLVS